uniref:Uncharacterized protein n=1 Tax=Lepeophtheirus salmonis TaxID=72036 RepID=A0A0K2V2B1_LEPSM
MKSTFIHAVLTVRVRKGYFM